MTQHSCHVLLCLVGLQNIISAEPLRRPSGCESELEETLVDLPGLLFFSLLSLAFLLHHSICLTAHCFLIVWCKSAVCVWNENKTQADQQSPSRCPLSALLCSGHCVNTEMGSGGVAARLFRDRSTLHSWLNSEDEVTGKCSSLYGVTGGPCLTLTVRYSLLPTRKRI